MTDPARGAGADREAGLCARCRFARTQPSARGSLFWRCLRADREPEFLRYPPLPVRSCRGFEAERAAPGPPKRC